MKNKAEREENAKLFALVNLCIIFAHELPKAGQRDES